MKVYYKQLIEGCGNPSCRHPLCAGTSESAQRTERSRITEESAKFLAAGLERMAHNYSCENLYSSILELKTEDSLETFTASDPEAQRETWTCPVATTNSVKEDPFINRLKQMVLNLHQYDGSPHYPRASSDSHVFGRYDLTRSIGDLYGDHNLRTEYGVGEREKLGRSGILSTIRTYHDLKREGKLGSPVINPRTKLRAKIPQLGPRARSCILHTSSSELSAVRNGVTVSRADNDTAVPRREKYFGLPFLTLDLIRALIRKRDSDKDDEVYGFDAQSDRDFLARSVQYVFSNKIALCSSFLRSPGSVDFKKNSDIDYKSLDKAYKIMNSLTPHLMFRDEIVAKLEQLLIEDIFNLDATNTCDCRYMRKYIVILENDHIWESSCALRFGRFISRIISYMDQQRKDTLSEWLARTNKDRLEKYVKIFNKCITNEFQPNSADPLLFIADYLQVLKLLYNSNQCRKKFCSAKSSSDVVPMSSFYNTAVSEGLNYKRQYKLIMSSKENEGSRPRNSILDYTFLLNPLGKTRLMRVGAVFEMLNKYGSAFMNIEIVNHTCRLFENQFFSLDIPTGLSSEITPFLVLEVRRDNIVDETIRQIHKKMNSLKKPLKVRFIDSGEMGVDQGGIQKEFFQIVVDKFLNPVYGMFAYDEETRLSWIDGSSKERSSTFEAFGIIQGLALYNGAILRLNFPSAIYKKLLDDDLDLEDLKSVFPSMGNSLQELLDYEHDDIEDVFLLDFTVSHESFGVINTVPLIKDGENIQVNKENRREFVSLVVKDVLVKRCRRQFEAYKSGFYKVLDKNLVKISSYDELELMICGREPASIDFVQLKDSTTYTNGYTSESPVIKWFWTLLLEEFTPEQRMAFLTFCTASNRMPLGGLKMLKFTISKNSSSTYRLPAAMTCFSTLMLPEYDSIDKLKHSLLTAIQCSSGFGLV